MYFACASSPTEGQCNILMGANSVTCMCVYRTVSYIVIMLEQRIRCIVAHPCTTTVVTGKNELKKKKKNSPQELQGICILLGSDLWKESQFLIIQKNSRLF